MNFYILSKKMICVILIIIVTLLSVIFAINMYFTDRTVNGNTQIGIKVPILMYHHILKDSSRLGKFVISPDELEGDIKYLKQKGYNFVFVKDLISYVYEGKTLPENPVIITFDDGYLSNYTYAFDLAKKENVKMCISIIGRYTDQYTKTIDSNVNYAHVTWDNVKEMKDSGLWEIGNHSYNMHTNNARKGCNKLSSETPEQYKQFLYNDVMGLQTKFKDNVEIEPNLFTFPFGYMGKEATQLIKEFGFKATLSCSEGMNYIIADEECLYGLKRYNRAHGIDREKFFDKVLQ